MPGWEKQGPPRSRAGWRTTPARILRRDPTCRLALEGICTTVSTEVDHIVPLHLGGTDADDNLQGLCHECHAYKTGREASAARRRVTIRRRNRPRHPGLL